jgi:hypothetical protein
MTERWEVRFLPWGPNDETLGSEIPSLRPNDGTLAAGLLPSVGMTENWEVRFLPWGPNDGMLGSEITSLRPNDGTLAAGLLPSVGMTENWEVRLRLCGRMTERWQRDSSLRSE